MKDFYSSSSFWAASNTNLFRERSQIICDPDTFQKARAQCLQTEAAKGSKRMKSLRNDFF